MSSAILSLRLIGVPPVIRAARGEAVPQDFWLELWTEWGTEGPNPGHAVDLPLERFLSSLAWLRPACVRHDVSLEWDPSLVLLVAETRDQRRQLERVLAKSDDDGRKVDVAAVLAASRFERDMRAFQLRDLAKLLGLPHGANFSVPGAGKTTVAYAVYEAERTAGRVEQMLVVAPLSAFDAWENEVFECFPHDVPVVRPFADAAPDDAEILLVNYHRLAGSYAPIAEWVRARSTLVLLDEAHRMKRGWTGQWGSSCLNLAFLASRRDILTGTPAPQSPADLIALLDFLWPGQALRVLPSQALGFPTPSDAGHQVAQSIAPLFVRTRKSELELKAPVMNVVEVKPEPLHEAIYEALRDQYAGQFGVGMHDRLELARMGDIVMYLLEAATNPYLLSAGSASSDDPSFRHPPLAVPPDSSLWELLQRYNQYETPEKFIQLAQLVAANVQAGRKTLIWSNFVRNLLALERMLAAQQPALIYGAVPSEITQPEAERTREAELRRFREDPACTVMLANPASMSEGISLHHVCHDAIYLERTFNAGQYLQSVDRIHRLGLERGQETRITILVTTGTIDEVVDSRIRDKAERLGQMLDDPDITTMALPSDEDYGPAIDSHEDLEALFAHLRGES